MAVSTEFFPSHSWVVADIGAIVIGKKRDRLEVGFFNGVTTWQAPFLLVYAAESGADSSIDRIAPRDESSI